MDEQIFKQRTKKLALRIIELVEALPKSRTAEGLEDSCSALRHRLGPIIERRVEGNPEPTFYPSSPSLRKKGTNRLTGWNYSLKPRSLLREKL